MDVAANAASLFSDHQAQLRVRLEPDNPVHNVTAGLLEEACPSNVALLVEARLDLDEHHDLLASGGGAHEGIHDGALTGGPIQRLLDGKHLRIRCGLFDEPLRGPRE